MKYVLIILEIHYKQEAKYILDLLQNSIKIPYSDFKILFKSLKYIQSSLKSVLKYSWFGKGMVHGALQTRSTSNNKHLASDLPTHGYNKQNLKKK